MSRRRSPLASPSFERAQPQTQMEFEHKVALVTGGGSGIGAATAALFAREGARVAVLDLRLADAEATAQAVRDAGGEALAVEADISDPVAVEGAVRLVEGRWGRLDVVFANAGVNGVWAPADEIEPDEWRKTVSVNLDGTFHTVRYTVPLLKRRGGSVVITSSINGNRKFTSWGSHAYSSTKAAQVALTRTLAIELAKHRVRVNAVCPGFIETNIGENTEERHVEAAAEPVEYPEGSIPLTDVAPGTAEQVAEIVLFLASDRAGHITGTEVYVDGGESLLEG